MQASLKKLLNKALIFILTLCFINSGLGATGTSIPDPTYIRLQAAASNGNFNQLISVDPTPYHLGDGSTVQKITLNPETFGKLNYIYLIFDKSHVLQAFKINNRSPISLKIDQQNLLSLTKSHEQLIKAFFANPTDEFKDELTASFDKDVDPVADNVFKKVMEEEVKAGIFQGQMKTKSGAKLNDFFSNDAPKLSQKGMRWANKQATVMVKWAALSSDILWWAFWTANTILDTLAVTTFATSVGATVTSSNLADYFYGIARHAISLGLGSILFRSIYRAAKRRANEIDRTNAPATPIENSESKSSQAMTCKSALKKIWNLWSYE